MRQQTPQNVFDNSGKPVAYKKYGVSSFYARFPVILEYILHYFVIFGLPYRFWANWSPWPKNIFDQNLLKTCSILVDLIAPFYFRSIQALWVVEINFGKKT